MNADVISGLSPDQKKAFEEFKKRVIEEHGEKTGHDDYHLRRFLRAREFDIPKAEIMLRNNIAWRKKFDIDNILKVDDSPEVIKKYLPFSKIGLGVHDQLTRVYHYGHSDTRGLTMSAKRSDFVKFLTKSVEEDVETLKQKSKEEGREVEKWTYIFDFQDITLAQVTHKESVEILLHFLNIYEANYPERLEAAYIINASLYFTILFRLVKPLLSGETLRKVIILSEDDYKDAFGKLMSPESLPAYLGGYKTDPDGNPKCHSMINHGGLVPKSYYLSKTEKSIAHDRDCRSFSISRRSRVSVRVDVEEPGSRIEWQFETQNYDIGFGIHRSKFGSTKNKPEELVPIQRVDTRFVSETGMYSCDEPGTYFLVFDNTFSWWRQKEIHCKAYVVTASEQKTCVTR